MVQRRQRERSLFEVLLPDGHKLWPDWLRKIDTLLEDDAVIEVVAQALEKRWPQSRRRGRTRHASRGGHPPTDPEASVRLELRRHGARGARQFGVSDVYAHRRGDVPDAKTILTDRPRARPGGHRSIASTGRRGREACGSDARSPISHRHHGRSHECALSDRQHLAARRGTRADPHDAAREYTAMGDPRGRVRNRLRSVTRRVLTIAYEARSPQTRRSVGEELSRADDHDPRRAAGHGDHGAAPGTTRAHGRSAGSTDSAARPGSAARDAAPRQRVIAQTRARILRGDTHVPDKLLSVFEPHTETIRKGKIAKPNEFGKLVTIQESEHQIITAYTCTRSDPPM